MARCSKQEGDDLAAKNGHTYTAIWPGTIFPVRNNLLRKYSRQLGLHSPMGGQLTTATLCLPSQNDNERKIVVPSSSASDKPKPKKRRPSPQPVSIPNCPSQQISASTTASEFSDVLPNRYLRRRPPPSFRTADRRPVSRT